MQFEDRVKAVADFGFTERQARFLMTVMLHSGVCLLRQYTAFSGIVHGEKTKRFSPSSSGFGRGLPTRVGTTAEASTRCITRRCIEPSARPTAGIADRCRQRVWSGV